MISLGSLASLASSGDSSGTSRDASMVANTTGDMRVTSERATIFSASGARDSGPPPGLLSRLRANGRTTAIQQRDRLEVRQVPAGDAGRLLPDHHVDHTYRHRVSHGLVAGPVIAYRVTQEDPLLARRHAQPFARRVGEVDLYLCRSIPLPDGGFYLVHGDVFQGPDPRWDDRWMSMVVAASSFPIGDTEGPVSRLSAPPLLGGLAGGTEAGGDLAEEYLNVRRPSTGVLGGGVQLSGQAQGA